MSKQVQLTWQNGDYIDTEKVLMLELGDDIYVNDSECELLGQFLDDNDRVWFEDEEGIFILPKGWILEIKEV
jgi:hypothetical protein